MIPVQIKQHWDIRLGPFPYTVALPFPAPTGDTKDLERLLLRKVSPFVWRKPQKRVSIKDIEAAPVPE